MTVTATGQFWCNDCAAFFPDSIEATHLSSHAEAESYEYDEMSGPRFAVFAVYCITIGAVAALLVNSLL